jgi:hypothetical protein
MKLRIFAIHDSAVGAYLEPFFARAAGEAIRRFEVACNTPDHPFCQRPADYTLFELGEYDDETGEFQQAVNISLGNGVDFVETTPKLEAVQ